MLLKSRTQTQNLVTEYFDACRFRRKDMILQRNVLSVFPQGERPQRLHLVLRLGKSEAATAECRRCSLHLCTTNSLLQLNPGYLLFESRLLKTNLLELNSGYFQSVLNSQQLKCQLHYLLHRRRGFSSSCRR